MKLGPITEWGLNMDKAIDVNPALKQTKKGSLQPVLLLSWQTKINSLRFS